MAVLKLDNMSLILDNETGIARLSFIFLDDDEKHHLRKIEFIQGLTHEEIGQKLIVFGTAIGADIEPPLDKDNEK
ncbi:MAG: hypothetical protein DRH08_07090 [Deltaproteobacteria bacterium]|nr:MAG: hypothetical protein DRH08_07090 [Deltaproteobacteria bacterium]